MQPGGIGVSEPLPLSLATDGIKARLVTYRSARFSRFPGVALKALRALKHGREVMSDASNSKTRAASSRLPNPPGEKKQAGTYR